MLASRGHGRCLGLWDVSVAFFNAAIEEEVFARPTKERVEGQVHLEILESHRSLESSHKRTVCCTQ